MEFGVLGPVEARVDGAPRPCGAGRERYVLATLLLGAGRPTTSARLIDALWDDPPRSAKAQLHNIISRLRRNTGRTDLIFTHATGYELRLNGKDTLDAAEFRGLVAAGRHARAAGDPAAAAELFDRALGLWRGPALADLPDELAAATRTGLHEERLAAREARLDAWLVLGRHTDMLTELAPLLAEHPYRESLYEARMLAFAGAGRRADALATYREAHRTLAGGLGIEPGPVLRHLEQRIARGEDVTPVRRRPARVVARQLPPPAAILTGRDELVAAVRAALDGPGPVTAVLVGPGGVGKTAVALAAAGRTADEFTGGQLYADLRGTADPHVVVGRFLHALGVRQAALPRDQDERVALYRSLLAGSRTLVVLDDAASAEQVRPLLPADPGCAALVTSRHQLAALVGAHRWTVPVLEQAAAIDLLGRIAGEARVAAEPEAAAELAAVCGRFPLAVSIVAARLAVRQDWTLTEFAARLARERDRLDELAVGDLDVRAGIGSSYATLSAGGARLLRLLGLVTATDWPAWVPTALFGADARGPLDELVDVHLVAPSRRDGAGQERFRLHDLVADFAREEVAEEEHTEQAVHRVIEGWLALAAHADRQVPHGEAFAPPIATEAPPIAVTRPYEWFDAERASLSTAVGDAVRIGRADLAGRLALHMSGYLELRCFYEDWLGALQTAIPPVRAAGHDELLVRLLGATCAAHSLADRYAEMPAVAEEELAVARRLGDRAAEVIALVHTGRAARDTGRFGQAAERLAAAVTLAGEPGPVLVEALTASAVLHIKAGDPAQAVELLNRVRELDDDPGHTARGALYRYLTGLALIDLDRLDEARVVLAEGRTVCEAIEDDVGIVYLGWASANVDIGAGEWQAAASKLACALRGAEKLGATDAVAEVLRSLGDLAAAQARPQAAADALHRSLAIWRDLGARIQAARTLARLEHVARALGDDAVATACHREWRGLLTELELDERCLRLPRFLR